MMRSGDTESDQGQISVWRSREADDGFAGPAGEWLLDEIRAELAAAAQTIPDHPLFERLELLAAGEHVLLPAVDATFERLAEAIARLSPMQRDVVMRSLRYTDFDADVRLARAWKVSTQGIRACRERTVRRLAQLVQPPL